MFCLLVYVHMVIVDAAELETNGPFIFMCDDGTEVMATFTVGDPPTAQVERSGTVATLEITPSGSGAEYSNGEIDFWEKGGEAQLTWKDTEIKCGL